MEEDVAGSELSPQDTVSDQASMTRTGDAMGTTDYMAPEQASRPHAVDIRADIYSLGCTLYKLLTGGVPFGGPKYNTSARKRVGHRRDAPPPIQASRGDVPSELAAVIDRMLAKKPLERFSTPASGGCRGAVRCRVRSPEAARRGQSRGAERGRCGWAARGRVSGVFAAETRTALRESWLAVAPSRGRRRLMWLAAGGVPAVFLLALIVLLNTSVFRRGQGKRSDAPPATATEPLRATAATVPRRDLAKASMLPTKDAKAEKPLIADKRPAEIPPRRCQPSHGVS